MMLQDRRCANTRRNYAADLRDFFGGTPNPGELQVFLSQDTAGMAFTLNAYKGELLSRQLSEATINRRLAALKSLIRFARRIGACLVDPKGLVDNERVRAYRDTAGISVDEVRAILSQPNPMTVKGKRDLGILRLLCDNALRRAEVCALDTSDFRPEESRLYILGKGRGTQKEPITLNVKTVEAITAYLEACGRVGVDGPLFLNCDRRGTATRLTPEGLYRVVQFYARKAGISKPMSPHRLRHSAITAALDASEGNVRAVQKFSRHARIETLLLYDDNRQDMQGEITRMLGDTW